MIVLDTNVVSELARLVPSPQVTRWFDAYPTAEMYITAITQAEILTGTESLPLGKRRTALEKVAQETFETSFANRILPFDGQAARAYALIAVGRRKLGRPISQSDAQIAAIARTRGAALATRNAGDFEHCGVKVLNPWA